MIYAVAVPAVADIGEHSVCHNPAVRSLTSSISLHYLHYPIPEFYHRYTVGADTNCFLFIFDRFDPLPQFYDYHTDGNVQHIREGR